MKKTFSIFAISASITLFLYFKYMYAKSLSLNDLLVTVVFFIMSIISMAFFIDFIRSMDSFFINGDKNKISKIYAFIRILFFVVVILFGVFTLYALIFDNKSLSFFNIAIISFVGLFFIYSGIKIIYHTMIFLKGENVVNGFLESVSQYIIKKL